HDARHSGGAATDGPRTETVRWRRQLEAAVTAGPVVAPDGTIYASSNGGVLHALDPSTGADRWTYDSGQRGGGDLSVSPLVLPDSTALFPTPGRELVALSPAGRTLWSERLPGAPTSPASVDGHRVYVGDTSGYVSALEITPGGHRLVWTLSVGSGSYGSVVVDGGRLYTTTSSSLVAVDDRGERGTVVWTRNPGDDITEVSAGRVQAWDIRTGRRAASYGPLPAQIWSSTVLDRGYRLYFGTQDGHVLGLAPDGTRLFDVRVGGPVDSYPALSGDGVLLVGSRDGTLTAIG
ncbi:MAG: PQQ-binding-like beta-propeller repeat protein, partial [Actinomycetota bacterium]|nr:PQQ-binding-like beta-propeller repeat protein [Actinomycetota bacterium]